MKIAKFNLLLDKVSILHPLKSSENQRFPDDFRGCKMGALVRNGLKVPTGTRISVLTLGKYCALSKRIVSF